VLRADLASITIRAGANVQDGSVLHTPPGVPCEIGRGATIAHLCMVHGATVGEEALIGNNSTVLDGASIGARSMIAAQSLVLGGTQIPDEVFVTGSPAKVKGPIAGTNTEFWVKANPGYYQELARRHIAGLGLV
jgi:carbonic anhydrase/acetyltransferase-like protein (isoleucine patch superfamily)